MSVMPTVPQQALGSSYHPSKSSEGLLCARSHVLEAGERQTLSIAGEKEEMMWRGECTGEEEWGGRRDLVLSQES